MYLGKNSLPSCWFVAFALRRAHAGFDGCAGVGEAGGLVVGENTARRGQANERSGDRRMFLNARSTMRRCGHTTEADAFMNSPRDDSLVPFV
jgi:hypothetical protein